jgi:hypothetical protein
VDLLVLPEFYSSKEGSWAREVDFRLSRVPEFRSKFAKASSNAAF